MGIRSKLHNTKEAISGTMDTVNSSMITYNINRYYMAVAKERNITFDEAVFLCTTDPELSLGLKLADPTNVFAITTRKGKERFRQTLTPEELKIFDADGNKNFKRALRKGIKAKA